MSCPFHSVPPHLWSPSHSLPVSLLFFLPCFFLLSLCLFLILLQQLCSPDTKDSLPQLFINAAAVCSVALQKGGAVQCTQVSVNEEHWSIFIKMQWDFNTRRFPSVKSTKADSCAYAPDHQTACFFLLALQKRVKHLMHISAGDATKV